MTKLVILGRKSQTGNYESAFFEHFPRRTVTTLVPGEVTSCDALILPGGGDITPAFFGEKNKGSRTVDTELDILQFQALDIAIAARNPCHRDLQGHAGHQCCLRRYDHTGYARRLPAQFPFRRCVSCILLW